MRLLIILPKSFSNCHFRSSNLKIQVQNHSLMLFDFFLFPLFLRVSLALTITITFSAWLFDFHVDWINQGTYSAALTSRCTVVSESSMTLSCSRAHSSSASQSSSLTFGLSRSQFQSSQLLVSEILSGAQSWWLYTGWRSIFLIRRTFNIWVCPPRRSCEDKAGGWGDLSNNLNAVEPSCWMFVRNAFTISSVSELNRMAVICLFWTCDSLWVAWSYWLPCHISKMSWTLAILCNFLSSATLFGFMLFSASVVSNTGLSPANVLLLARAYCPTMTFSKSISSVVFECLHRITSHPREKLASTSTPCGTKGIMLRATSQRSAYFECVSSCWCHRSVISGNNNVLLISMGSEW